MYNPKGMRTVSHAYFEYNPSPFMIIFGETRYGNIKKAVDACMEEYNEFLYRMGHNGARPSSGRFL